MRGRRWFEYAEVVVSRAFSNAKFRFALYATALAFATFLILSYYPCIYLCPLLHHYKEPSPPPPRSFSERVEHVQQVVRNQRQYLPLSAEYIRLHESSNTDIADDWYDIFNCPMQPPPSYPMEFPIMNVLNHWPIADTKMTDTRYIHQGFCVFDFAKQQPEQLRQQMHNYQKAEKPFVVKNHPEALKTAERWNTAGYLDYKLQRKVYRGEFSKTLSMMYWSISRFHKIPKGFVPPTQLRPTTFEKWKLRAEAMEQEIDAATSQSEDKVYLRLDGCESPNKRCDALQRMWGALGAGIYLLTRIDDADFMHDELPFFSPRYYSQGTSKDFLVEPEKSRGIQCRFGAKGTQLGAAFVFLTVVSHLLPSLRVTGLVAEDHFDNERNFIAVLGGERRYLLSHPNNCKDLYLYPMAHPLERHTEVNWFSPDLTKFPNFEHVHVNEVVLQAGDIMYLPTYWFHHIVSLTLNYQCNVRSGHSLHYDQDIYDCGFLYPWPA